MVNGPWSIFTVGGPYLTVENGPGAGPFTKGVNLQSHTGNALQGVSKVLVLFLYFIESLFYLMNNILSCFFAL